MTKMTYEAPIMRAHGKVEALTKGFGDGGALDAAFPVGTPRGKLTFS